MGEYNTTTTTNNNNDNDNDNNRGGGKIELKCISTTPIGAPIYIWPRVAIPPVPPLQSTTQDNDIIISLA